MACRPRCTIQLKTRNLQENRFPTPDEAVEIYKRTYHGHITEPSAYGTDLLEDDKELQQIRYNDFIEYHNIKLIFADIVNGTTYTFRSGSPDMIPFQEEF